MGTVVMHPEDRAFALGMLCVAVAVVAGPSGSPAATLRA